MEKIDFRGLNIEDFKQKVGRGNHNYMSGYIYIEGEGIVAKITPEVDGSYSLKMDRDSKYPVGFLKSKIMNLYNQYKVIDRTKLKQIKYFNSKNRRGNCSFEEDYVIKMLFNREIVRTTTPKGIMLSLTSDNINTTITIRNEGLEKYLDQSYIKFIFKDYFNKDEIVHIDLYNVYENNPWKDIDVYYNQVIF